MTLPGSPYDPPADVASEGRRSWRRDVVAAALVIVALELVAVPVGLLWGHLAPHPLYSTGGHQLNLVVGDAKPLVRGDAWFLLITGVAGIVSGIVAFFAIRRAEIGATVGLAIGGLAASWLAWRVGHAWTGGMQPLALALTKDGTHGRLAADLGARVVLVGWAVAAVAVHGLFYALTWPAKSRREPAEEPFVDVMAPSSSGRPHAES